MNLAQQLVRPSVRPLPVRVIAPRQLVVGITRQLRAIRPSMAITAGKVLLR